MPRGGQRGYGNGGRSAYGSGTKGSQQRAVKSASTLLPSLGPAYAYAPLPITIATRAAIYGMVKVRGSWIGALFRLVRASDGATMDVFPIASGLPDYAAIDAWIGASSAKIDIRYDQSGNGFDETQTNDALRPIFSAVGTERGVRPCMFPYFTETVRKYLSIPAMTGLNVQALGTYQINSIQSLGQATTQIAFQDTGGAADVWTVAGANGISPTSATGLRVYPPCRIHRQYNVNDVANSRVIMSADGQTNVAATPRPAAAIASGGKEGANTAVSASSLHTSFVTVIYSTAPTDSDIVALNAWADAAFALPARSSYTRGVLYNGHSRDCGRGETLNRNPVKLMGFAENYCVEDWGIVGIAMGGGSGKYASMANVEVKAVAALGVPTVVKLVDLSNDVGSATFTSQADAEAWADALFASSPGTYSGGAVDNVVFKYIAAVKAIANVVGVVLPTIVPRGSFTNANFQTYARTRCNLNTRNLATSIGYTVSELATIPQLQDPTDLTYFINDLIHTNDVGTQYVADMDKAAILTAFAAAGYAP